MENILIYGIILTLSTNFLTFALGTEIRIKNKITVPLITFGLIQFLLFYVGWGLGSIIENMIPPYYQFVTAAIVMFIGVKRILKYFTVKENARKFRIDHIFDAVGLSVAVAIDALILGLGLSLKYSQSFVMAIFLFVMTLLFGLMGIIVHQRKGCSNRGRIVELVSGIVLFVLGNILIIN